MTTATKTFEYAVRDRRGKLVSGKLEAPSEAAVVAEAARPWASHRSACARPTRA